METVIIKVSDATVVALDWLVAKCEGVVDHSGNPKVFRWTGSNRPSIRQEPVADTGYYHPTTDWAQGGPIVERMLKDGLLVHALPETSRWIASVDKPNRFIHGPTLLIAAMRCFVASKLGDEVEVPKELA